MAERIFTQQNADGSYSLVATDDAGNFREMDRAPSQAFIEQEYNLFTGQGGAPMVPRNAGAGYQSPMQFNPITAAQRGWTVAQGTPSGYPTQNLVATDLYQLQMQALAQEYLTDQLQMLEIPRFQAQTALERHNQAIQLAAQRAAATGFWIEPGQFESYLAGNPVTAGIVPAEAKVSADIENIRTQMRNAGFPDWNHPNDNLVVAAFLNVSVPEQGTPQGDLQRRALVYREWLSTPGAPEQLASFPNLGEMLQQRSVFPVAQQAPAIQPQGQLTMAGAQAEATLRPFLENLSMLGGGIPSGLNVPGTPTLDWRSMASQPQNIPATLLSLGMPRPQAEAYLRQTPFVQSLINMAGTQGQPGVFPVQGYQLPVRETLQSLRTQAPAMNLMSGLWSFGGYDPNQEWAKFQEALPKGSLAPLTSYY